MGSSLTSSRLQRCAGVAVQYLGREVQCSEIQFSSSSVQFKFSGFQVQCSSSSGQSKFSVVQFSVSAMQCSPVQCSAVKCSTVQCSAVQYSAVNWKNVGNVAHCLHHTKQARCHLFNTCGAINSILVLLTCDASFEMNLKPRVRVP
jgi:hypothetical protein